MILFVPALEKAKGLDTVVIDEILAIGPRGTLTPIDPGATHGTCADLAWLVPLRDEGPSRRGVALLASPDHVRVNGLQAQPLMVLRRGDEIRVDGVSLFYTDEGPLRVVPFHVHGEAETSSASASPECTRCHGAIRAGDPVVYCPVCSAVYMAQADRSPNCWEFGPCLSCGRDPGAEFAWQPGSAVLIQPWHERPWRNALPASRFPDHPEQFVAAGDAE
jgi:hypothetical protein